MNDNLVTAAWLEAHLDSPDIAIVDASWHLPAMQRDARAEFLEGHIPGAQFFDIDELSDTASALPHMLPSPEKFSSRMRKLGIGDGFIRLSCGVEDLADLRADLERAFAAARG